MAIKDKMALGSAAGITDSFPALLLNFLSVQLGMAKYYNFEIATSIYLYPALTHRVLSRIFGSLI